MKKCKRHPQYRARRKPPVDCAACCEMYKARRDRELTAVMAKYMTALEQWYAACDLSNTAARLEQLPRRS